jgi:putative FmdB family regulatory protein
MPTYEYECTSCGNHIEVFQRFTEDPLTTCGVCGGTLRKVFHPAGIVFKGSGFYATDSRSRPGSKKDGEGASKTSSEGASKGSSEGPSKPSEAASKGSDGASNSSSPSKAKESSSS